MEGGAGRRREEEGAGGSRREEERGGRQHTARIRTRHGLGQSIGANLRQGLVGNPNGPSTCCDSLVAVGALDPRTPRAIDTLRDH
jgi:hypothetical protein